MNQGQSKWQRIILLIILCYEALGCLIGGSFLIEEPDGRLMSMPVDLMHGAFLDFLVPGIVLLGLGILNAFAFISVLRKSAFDWFMTGLALGGLFIWFWVEIAILREVHWLHAMWGIPVFIGILVYIPLIVSRHDAVMMTKVLLACGVLSSLWYVAINIFVPVWYEGYNIASYTVSELSAIDSPTRILWLLLVFPYPILFTAFGWGVLNASGKNKHLKVTGILIIAYSVFNFYWPPMHQREVIAGGGGTLTDTLHIVWAMITILFMIAMMGFGSTIEKKFRLYTIVTFIVFIAFGVLIGIETPGIDNGLPTPLIGVWERLNIGAFMLWVAVFANTLLRKQKNVNAAM